MTELHFTKADVWIGGFYELALEIDPPSDVKLYTALEALWQHPTLEGCYLASDVEPSQQTHVLPSMELMQSGYVLFGLATLPNGKRTACQSALVREEDGSDWLDLCIPLGALSRAYPEVGGFPFIQDFRSADVWRTPIDAWLVSIGRYIFSHVPFQLGIVGMEVSGISYAKDVAANGIPEPRQRDEIYLWPRGEQLQYFPR